MNYQLDLVSDGIMNILLSGMTILAGTIEKNGDVILASDGCASSDDGKKALRHDAIKTARLNDSWGIGYAGGTHGANLICASLFGKQVIHERLFERLQEQNANREDLTGDEALDVISQVIDDLRRDLLTLAPDGFLLMGGESSNGPGLFIWSGQKTGWFRSDIATVGTSTRILICPAGIGSHTLLDDENLAIEDRMRKLLDGFAGLFPNLVDRNLAIRRLSKGFRLERFSS